MVRGPPAATHSRLLRPAPGPGLGSQQQGEEDQDQDILRLLRQQVGVLSVVRGDICHENTVAVTAWCTAPRWRGQRRASAGGAAQPQLQVLVTWPRIITSFGFILSIRSRIESE